MMRTAPLWCKGMMSWCQSKRLGAFSGGREAKWADVPCLLSVSHNFVPTFPKLVIYVCCGPGPRKIRSILFRLLFTQFTMSKMTSRVTARFSLYENGYWIRAFQFRSEFLELHISDFFFQLGHSYFYLSVQHFLIGYLPELFVENWFYN